MQGFHDFGKQSVVLLEKAETTRAVHQYKGVLMTVAFDRIKYR
jgi:hypothetical protein